MSQLQNYQRPFINSVSYKTAFFAFSFENDRGLTKKDTALNMVCEHDAFIHVSGVILLASNVGR